MRLALLLMTAGCALPGLALARRSDLRPLADSIQRVLYWTGIPLVVIVLSGAPVRSAGLAVGVAIACLSLTAVAARTYARRRFADHGERAAFTLSAFWPNSGWLGLPVAVAVLGSAALPSALLYSSVASGPHNFVVGGSVAAAGRPRGAKVGLLASVRHNHYLPAIALGLAWAFSGLPRSAVLSSTAGWIARRDGRTRVLRIRHHPRERAEASRPRHVRGARTPPRPLPRAVARNHAIRLRSSPVPAAGRHGDRTLDAHHGRSTRPAVGAHRADDRVGHRARGRRRNRVGGLHLSRRAAPVEGIAADLAYGEWPGAEPAVVLVPGIFATHRAVASLALHLAPARRVVAFDLRGRGRSPGTGPFGIERHASELWRAIDALGLRQPLLCGHSLGGFVVAIAAAARPDASSGVVLLDGGLWAPYPVPVELVHAVFADDRARLDRTFPDVETYSADREIEATLDVLEELGYELQPAGDLLTPVMPVEAFDEDVASIAAHTAGTSRSRRSAARCW